MNIRDYKIGDIAVFRDGTEAKITNKSQLNEERQILWFSRAIKGLLIGSYSSNWIYNNDGKFETSRPDGNDIVKIIRS